jgi:hypothetical protein
MMRVMDTIVVAALIGSACGACSIVGGALGAWFIAWRDDHRREVEHKAAVRAVVHELEINLATFEFCQQQGTSKSLVVSTGAYQAFRMSLFTGNMPEHLMSALGVAYGMLMVIERGPDPTARWDNMQLAIPGLTRAHADLMDYAKKTIPLAPPGQRPDPGLASGRGHRAR